MDVEIFFLDFLSIYKDINIVLVKLSLKEWKNIKYYVLDYFNIDEKNNVFFFKIFLEDVMRVSFKEILFIVGGSSFYLKFILEGLSSMLKLSDEEVVKIEWEISVLVDFYVFLKFIDFISVFKIYLNDIYCIYKVLEIFYVIYMFLSEYFKVNFKKFFEYVVLLFVFFIEKSMFYNNIK